MWDSLDPRSSDIREPDPRDRSRDVRDPRNDAWLDPRDALSKGLDLPRGVERERVYVDEERYDLRGSETRTLATVGAFRVVALDDLREPRDRSDESGRGDLSRLRSAGLVRAVAPLDREDRRTTLVTLTERGRTLLETHRTRDHEPRQQFYAGVGRSRELSHDAHFYRAYLRAAERLARDGARVHRVTLDHELKREYQQFLQERNRDRPDSDGRPDRTREEIAQWAHAHDLSVLDDHVRFPDLRLEYEWPDGRREIENIEVTTLHYRGAHALGKARAGFTRYRAGGGRVGGRSSRRGARPFDPGIAEEYLS